MDAHRLIGLAGEELRQDAMVETLFRAYFMEGADLSSTAELLQLAQRAGLDPQRAQACLNDEAARAAVLDEDRQARELGVEGVPFFVFNRRLAVSGAQEPEVVLPAALLARERPELRVELDAPGEMSTFHYWVLQ